VSEFLFADGFVVNVPDVVVVVVRFSLNDEFGMGEYDSLLTLLSTLLFVVVLASKVGGVVGVFNEFKEGLEYTESDKKFRDNIDGGRSLKAQYGKLWSVRDNTLKLNKNIKEYIDKI
jgi:hypothetical protein